jgi:hypothetical protein
MKLLLLPAILFGVLCLTSCGLQSLGRSVGFGIEQSEVKGEDPNQPKVRFEIEERRIAK